MRRLFILIAVTSICITAHAQDKLLTIDDIYDPVNKVNFGERAARLQWLKDGEHYLQFEVAAPGSAPALLKVNAVTGEAEPFFDAAKMEAALANLAGLTSEDRKQMARQRTYHLNPAETAALINYANDLFYYEFGSDRAFRLTNDPQEEVGEQFSPDGRMVSFVRGNNIYVVDLATQRERALTVDAGAKVLNGRLDWVYQEELYGRGHFDGYWWSPDSSKLAYLRLDESPVHEFTVVDHLPYLQRLEVTPYPIPGDPNPKVQLGVVAAAGGPTKWIDTYKYQQTDPLIVRVTWTPDSKKVVYQIQNREQTWLDLNFADPRDGKSETVVKETSKAWVQVLANPLWLKDCSFLWESERNGWRHLYLFGPDGKLARQVTDGKWEVREVHGIDEANGLVYFSGTEHSYTGSDAYRIKLDGTALTRLTQGEGTHQCTFNAPLSLYIDQWSDVSTPPQVRLFNSDGALKRAIDENPVPALAQYKLGKPEFVHVKTRDGFVMEAMMIKPPDFDPAKKYPVWSFTYSGPHAQQVRNSWGGAAYMWHQLLAEKGYIIWLCDNRTASGKGAESTWQVYRNFGELELRDLEDGLAWLKSQPYVDGSRIGLWGWSYGGFMTSYALTHSKTFRIGIAGGTVADWRDYDSIYTERYMGTPEDNPEGYRKSSPRWAAKDLSGKLLLLHGAIDDNVHMQNTIQLVYELQKAGKQFQLMVYPESRHGVTDPQLVKQMRQAMTDFILANL